MIAAELLRVVAPRCREHGLHAGALERARLGSTTLTTPRRVAHWLGQILVETAGLTELAENLNYRTPERLDAVFEAVRGTADAAALIRRGPEAIANRVYGGRLGNGPESSGDGWRYRGSGYAHLTGRANFKRMQRDLKLSELGLDIVARPDQAREPMTAAMIAARFFDAGGCAAMADAGSVERITRVWNGPGMMGLAERRAAVLACLDALL